MRFSRRLWLLLLTAIFCALGPSLRADDPPTIFIFDVHDTIQRRGISPRAGWWAKALTHLTWGGPFTGMEELLHGLEENHGQIYYVSGATGPAVLLVNHFMKTSDVPTGTLITRPSLGIELADFKSKTIIGLMKANPKARFVLVGDNGESDVEAYNRVQLDSEVGQRVAGVFIHQVYDEPITSSGSFSSERTPLPFLTAADLALQFQKLGALRPEQVAPIFQKVYDEMHRPKPGGRSSALPPFARFNLKDLETSYPAQYPASEQEAPTSYHPLRRLLVEQAGRCPGFAALATSANQSSDLHR